MAIKSQIRLQQLTGSIGAGARQINDATAAAASTAIDAGDLSVILSHMAAAIKRIHGDSTFSEAAAGTFSQDLVVASPKITIGDGTAEDTMLVFDGNAQDYRIGLDDSNDTLEIGLGSAHETTPAVVINTDLKVMMQADASVGDDLDLLSDAAVLSFGADKDTSLTHSADTGLLLNSSRQMQFGDSGTYIHQSADAALDLVSDGSINATVGAAGVVIKGTTPKLTIGDAGAEDTMLVFDGNAQDYRIGLDDGTDKLEIGLGSTMSTTIAMTIDSSQQVKIHATTAASSTTTGALSVAGGASIEADLYIGDDLELDSDDAKIGFGADSDTSLTHVADTGLLLNSSRQIQFGDSQTHIKQVSDSNLEVEADGSIIFDAPVIDLEDDGVILKFGDDSDVSLTHVADTGLLLNSTMKIQFNDASQYIQGNSATELTLAATDEINLDATTIDLNGALDCSGNLTVGGNLTVNGTTVTLDTTNLNVEDPFIFTNDGAQSLNSNTGIVFASGSATAARPDVVFGRLGNNIFGLGAIAGSSGSLTNATSMNTADDIKFRAREFQIADANNYIQLDTDLKVIAAADIILDPAGGDVKVDGNLLPNSDNGGALGAAGTEWADVFLNEGAVINFHNGDATLMHVSGRVTSTGHFRMDGSKKLQLGGGSDYLHLDTDVKLIAAADILLDPAGGDVFVDGNLIPNADDGGALGHSSKNWSDIYLADAAVLNFGDDQDVTLTHVADTGLLLGGSKFLQFGDSGTKISQPSDGTLGIEGDGLVKIESAGYIEAQAPYLQVGNGSTNQAILRLLEDGSNGSNYVSFGAPATLGGNYTFTLPNGNGTDGYVLKTDGSGITSWVAQGGAANSIKTVASIGGTTLAANALLSSDAGYSATDYSAISQAHGVKVIDVFVNGQLMVSGSGPQDGSVGGGGDYIINRHWEANLDVKFDFVLEKDDVVTIIGRA